MGAMADGGERRRSSGGWVHFVGPKYIFGLILFGHKYLFFDPDIFLGDFWATNNCSGIFSGPNCLFRNFLIALPFISFNMPSTYFWPQYLSHHRIIDPGCHV